MILILNIFYISAKLDYESILFLPVSSGEDYKAPLIVFPHGKFSVDTAHYPKAQYRQYNIIQYSIYTEFHLHYFLLIFIAQEYIYHETAGEGLYLLYTFVFMFVLV